MTDTQGNKITNENRIIYLYLVGGERRQLGILDECSRLLLVRRVRDRHLHRQTNSYGFNLNLMTFAKKFHTIRLDDEHGRYLIPREVIIEEGKQVFYGEQGFEVQIFVPLDIIEKYKI